MKIAVIGLIISFLAASTNTCGHGQNEVKRTFEDGVEVVNNPLHPQATKGEPSHLALEKRLVLDFETDDLAQAGIPKITGFDIDSKGNIYVWTRRSSQNYIFRFDPSGRFVSYFGRGGQGPGEIVGISYLRINERDEIIVSDYDRNELITLKADGEFVSEIHIPAYHTATFLASGKILAWKDVFDPEEGVSEIHAVICDADLNEISSLRPTERLPNWARAKKINGLGTMPTLGQGSISRERIFVGNKQSGYQIWVYDLNGTLIRKIKKEYRPVPVPAEIKERVLKVFGRSDLEAMKIKEKVFFPDFMPAIQYLFTDDEGRLFVMTFEKGKSPGFYVYDIFNPEGVFIGRTSLDNSGNESAEIWGGPFEVRAKNNLLYHLRAKDSGYQELVVYQMHWTTD